MQTFTDSDSSNANNSPHTMINLPVHIVFIAGSHIYRRKLSARRLVLQMTAALERDRALCSRSRAAVFELTRLLIRIRICARATYKTRLKRRLGDVQNFCYETMFSNTGTP